MFMTLRSKIFLAFMAMGIITGLLACYGIANLAGSSHLIVQTYDKPLMSINYARAVMTDFAALEAAFARWNLENDPARRSEIADRMEELTQELDGDLNIVAQRSMSERARRAVGSVRDAVSQWQDVRRVMMVAAAEAEQPSNLVLADRWERLDGKAAVVAEQADLLINFAAGDGFLGRQQAVASIEDDRRLYTAASVAALLLSAAITILLARVIIGPVRAASIAAQHMADGELNIAIPTAGADELGTLLTSMEVMRGSIRSMIEREIGQRRSAQRRLVDAIESSREGVILVDGNGCIAVANSQAAEFLPAVRDHLMPGLRFADFAAAAVRRGAFATESHAGLQERLVTADLPSASEEQLANGRWLRISRSGTGEGGFVAICSDITAIKMRERELLRARDKAEAASRSKTEFLTNMSHELRTPLNAVIGFSDIIATEMFGPIGQPKYKEFAQDILSSGRHLLDVINDILDIARSEAGKLQVAPEPVDVAALFDDCHKIVHLQCSRASLDFEMTPPGDAVRVLADPVKARQILLNLLSNAVKFTPAGGRVSLDAAVAAGGLVRITVSDTGIGMNESEIPTALSPFGQLDAGLARKYEGTGLGLPLTNALIALHGGRMVVDSTPGKGTTIDVLLPIYVDADIAVAA